MFSNSSGKVSVCPEFPAPELFLYLGAAPKYLPGRDALDERYNLGHVVRWNGLHEEVHVIFISTYFKEFHLISLLDFNAYVFHHCVHIFVKYCSSILCWKNQMVHQYRNVMALVCVFAHITTLRPKGRGIQP